MIDQVQIPKDFLPGRQIRGIRAVAKFLGRAAYPAQQISHGTVTRYLIAGLLRPATTQGAGSRPAIWQEGQLIEDLKLIALAVQVADGRDRKGAVTISEIRQIQIEKQKESTNGH